MTSSYEQRVLGMLYEVARGDVSPEEAAPGLARAGRREAAAALRSAADEDSVAIAPAIPGVAVLRFVKTGDLLARADALEER